MTSRRLALDFGLGLKYDEFTITYKDLTAAGTSQSIPLLLLKARGKILGVHIKHSTQFAASGATALTVSVGNASSATAYAAAFNLLAAVADTTLSETALFKAGQESAVQVLAVFSSTGANLNTATAGSVTIRILYIEPTTE